MKKLTCLELCSGGGGQALGFERAGYRHIALIENDAASCQTLRANRPYWNVIERDIRAFDGRPFRGKVDVLAAGLPCPPFSVAGQQRGAADERDLFPTFLRLVREIRPKGIMIENVRGFLSPKFDRYRSRLLTKLQELGYVTTLRIVDATDFGVPQHRQRVIIVALLQPYFSRLSWRPSVCPAPPTVGQALLDLMAEGGWTGAKKWAAHAAAPAPTIVGGSHKHGGADLGPSRTKAVWRRLGVEGTSLADTAPGPGHVGLPRLTNAMVQRLQGFPDDWMFVGGKTKTYRQIGNALPPAIAEAVARRLARAIRPPRRRHKRSEG